MVRNLFPAARTILLLILVEIMASSCRKDSLAPDNLLGKWQVTKIREPNVMTTQTVEKPYILEFRNDGSFTFQRDVNLCHGEYLVPEAGKINLVGISCTEICCDTKIVEATTWLFSGTTTYNIKKKILTLSGDGEIQEIQLKKDK